MRTKRRILWLAVILVPVAVGWFMFGHFGEPRYEGRSLSFWFKEYCRAGQWMGPSATAYDDAKREAAAAAFRHIGTSAVPYLLERSFDTNWDPASRSNFYTLLNDTLHSLGRPAMVRPFTMALEAPEAIKEIKPPAALLLPFMLPQLAATNGIPHRQALYLLGTVGDGAEQVVPFLTAALNEADAWNGYLAVQSLGWLGPKAAAAVPALMEAAQGPSNRTSYSALVTLGRIGSNAAPAIPLLQARFTQETNWSRQCSLAAALLKIDAGQTNALRFLVDGLSSHATNSGSANELGELGPVAMPAVHALVEALRRSTNSAMWSAIADALKKLAPTEAYLPAMKESLSSTDETMLIIVAPRILILDPADHEAQAALIDLVKKRSQFISYVVDTLGRAGPAAIGAVPVLQEALKSSDDNVRRSVAKALKLIEAKTK